MSLQPKLVYSGYETMEMKARKGMLFRVAINSLAQGIITEVE